MHLYFRPQQPLLGAEVFDGGISSAMMPFTSQHLPNKNRTETISPSSAMGTISRLWTGSIPHPPSP